MPSPPEVDPSVTRVPCPHCRELIHPEATLCPFCRQALFSKKPGTNAALKLVYFVVSFVLLYWGITTWSKYEAEKMMKDIESSIRP